MLNLTQQQTAVKEQATRAILHRLPATSPLRPELLDILGRLHNGTARGRHLAAIQRLERLAAKLHTS